MGRRTSLWQRRLLRTEGCGRASSRSRCAGAACRGFAAERTLHGVAACRGLPRIVAAGPRRRSPPSCRLLGVGGKDVEGVAGHGFAADRAGKLTVCNSIGLGAALGLSGVRTTEISLFLARGPIFVHVR